jgi:hypothetical protein
MQDCGRMMISRRGLFGLLAAAPVAAVAGNSAYATGGLVPDGVCGVVGEKPSEFRIPAAAVGKSDHGGPYNVKEIGAMMDRYRQRYGA